MKIANAPSRLRLNSVGAVLAITGSLGVAFMSPAMAQYSYDPPPPPQGYYVPYDNDAVISVYVDAPLYEPEPIAVGWAPPPMLVEEVPPPPDPDAVWTGGYWTWQGQWVWCAGRWMLPPRPSYWWVQPYYEHRYETVVFVPGYWSAPDVEFVAPAFNLRIPLAFVAVGVIAGPRPLGPQGIFIPPPPGSRPGIIIPAPIGTPPAVVISAPPVVNVGMRVHGNVEINSRNTTVNDNRVTYNVTNVRNVTNVTIEAPAAATSTGRAFQASVPARAHLAAAMPPVVQAKAPVPVSRTAVPVFVPGRAAPALPPPQRVHAVVNPEAARAPATPSQRQEPATKPDQKAAPAGISKPGTAAAPRPEAAPVQRQENRPQVESGPARSQPQGQAPDQRIPGMREIVPPVQQGQQPAIERRRAVVPAPRQEPTAVPQPAPEPQGLQRSPARAPATVEPPPRPAPAQQGQPAPRVDPRAQEEAARAAEAARAHAPAPRPVEASPHPANGEQARKDAEDRARRDKAHPEIGASGAERR